MNNRKVMDRDGLAARVDGFVAEAKRIIDEHYAKDLKSLKPPRVDVEIGPRYIKLVRADVAGSSRSVHCFIDRSNGDILKAASWRAPAKHPRGNVFEEDFGVSSSGLSSYGVRYM